MRRSNPRRTTSPYSTEIRVRIPVEWARMRRRRSAMTPTAARAGATRSPRTPGSAGTTRVPGTGIADVVAPWMGTATRAAPTRLGCVGDPRWRERVALIDACRRPRAPTKWVGHDRPLSARITRDSPHGESKLLLPYAVFNSRLDLAVLGASPRFKVQGIEPHAGAWRLITAKSSASILRHWPHSPSPKPQVSGLRYVDMRIAHVITRMIVGGAQENTLLCCKSVLSS